MLRSNSYLDYYAVTTSLALDLVMPMEHLGPHGFLSVHKGPGAPYPHCALVVFLYMSMITKELKLRVNINIHSVCNISM